MTDDWTHWSGTHENPTSPQLPDQHARLGCARISLLRQMNDSSRRKALDMPSSRIQVLPSVEAVVYDDSPPPSERTQIRHGIRHDAAQIHLVRAPPCLADISFFCL